MSPVRGDSAEAAFVWVVNAQEDLRRQVEIALGATHLVPVFRSLADPPPADGGAGAPDCVILDLGDQTPESSRIPSELGRACPPAALLLAVATSPAATLAAARRAGAFDLVARPGSPDSLEPAIRRAAEYGSLRRKLAALQERHPAGRDGALLAGGSRAAARLREQVEAIAGTDARVLVIGECGSGKGRVARAIHAASPRRELPFLRVSCTAAPAGTVLGAMLGSERPVPGGPTAVARGCLERAGRGSVLLEEVSELGLPLQAALAEAVRSGVFSPIGSARQVRLDARLLATAASDPRARDREGGFSGDLLPLLSGATLFVPPLRERREDIPILAARLLDDRAAETHAAPLRLSPAAAGLLMAHDWPGNVRELRNVLERGALLCGGEVLGVEHIVLGSGSNGVAREREIAAGRTLRERERAWILETLRETRGNRTAAALRLGVSVRTIRNKLAAYRADPTLTERETVWRRRRAA